MPVSAAPGTPACGSAPARPALFCRYDRAPRGLGWSQRRSSLAQAPLATAISGSSGPGSSTASQAGDWFFTETGQKTWVRALGLLTD